MGKTIVIYHAGCWDGFCSAWLFHYWLPTAEFIPAQYGGSPVDVSALGATRVFIVDFSYRKDILIGMAETCEVTVLDHHKTARDDLEDLHGPNLDIQFDMRRSGGRMAWDYLKQQTSALPAYLRAHVELNPSEPHWLVKYTEDRDLWRHALPGTHEINAGLRSYPLEFDEWDRLARDPDAMSRLLDEGSAILRYKTKLVQQHVRYARLATFCDGKYTVPAVNCSAGDLQSELAGQLAEGHDFGAVWVDQGDGKQLWSLRSREGGIDVSAVAKSYGGGGHASASGFRCEAGTISTGKLCSDGLDTPGQ
jgi:uncharacterized protein